MNNPFLTHDPGDPPSRWSWYDRAACRGMDTEMWFPESRADFMASAAAKRICGTCDVAAECLLNALNTPEKWGIWSGIEETRRRRLLPPPRPRRNKSA